MRDYIFHGKRVDNGEWVEGCLIHQGDHYLILQDESKLHPMDVPYINELGCIDGYATPVIPESVGEWTGINEYVVTDRSYSKHLFEGDIVEIWGWRSPRYTYEAKSQYDGDVKCRAVIYFKHGEWQLDYKNKYNEAIEKLKGKETDKREVSCQWSLHEYGSRNEEFDRAHNVHYNRRNIVKIGTVFENADLLEG